MHGHLNVRLCNVLRLSHWAAKRIYKRSSSTKKDMHQVLTYPKTSKEICVSDNTTKETLIFGYATELYMLNYAARLQQGRNNQL